MIPVRNGSQTIERAVKSAIDAGCDDVFVYDDHSTDGTYDVLKSLLSKYEQFYITASPEFHAGVNYARNYMIDCADNGLIIPLDADDELCDIAPLVAAWQPDTWVYGNHLEKHEHGETWVAGCAAGSLPRKNITGVTFLFHRDDWQKVGGYDSDFVVCEDWAFQVALTNRGIKPVYVDTVVYNRYLKPEGNERSLLANEYWTFYKSMARRKWPNVFAGT